MPSIGDTERALLQKGFKKSDSHHHYYYLYIDGKRTQIYTYMSHRPSGSDLYTPEIASMKRQMHFNSPDQFRSFVRCDINQVQYVDLLREKGVLDEED
jgi:hypothetical protein